MEEGGGGWVPDTPGKVNLKTADLICTELEYGCENEGDFEDGEGFVSQIPEENATKLVVHDPLASWNGIEFVDLLARADMGKIEPLLDFSSDSVRCSRSSFFLPGNGDVVAVDAHTWASNRRVSKSKGRETTEGDVVEKLHTQNFAATTTALDMHPSPEHGETRIPDLNATPQQKPKRRKHRPKVVIEGKVGRSKEETATVSTPKSTKGAEKRKYVRKKESDDTDNTIRKRKYVRKSGPPKSFSSPPNEGGEMVELKESKTSNKSCRKALDFDSDGRANDDSRRRTPGVKENPILVSDTDTDQEQEFSNISGCRIGIQQIRGEAKGKGDNLSRSIDTMSRSHTRVSNMQYSSVSMYQQLGTNVIKHESACVDLADLVHCNGDEQSSTTSNTSSTVTNGKNNGKLAKERWHCNPVAPPTSDTMARDSISKEKKVVTDRRPAQDANIDINALKDLPGNQASLNSQSQEVSKPSNAATPAKERAQLARRNRKQKRKQEQSLPSQGVNMGQLMNGSHSIPIAPHVDAIWEYLISVDNIVERLRDLDINRETRTPHQQCNALVPFEICYETKSIHDSRRNRKEEQKELILYNHNGTLIPFDSSQNKRRRPRAKVDLDEETSRVWRLLLENINSQGVDGTDEEKARWWESERKVFNGRANSFVARMHLVQGDRRLSKWKGSVVDSVVGVFLTQNVSDHLSSSAFMSLAARFPLKPPKSTDEQYHKEDRCGANIIHVVHPEDSAPLNSEISDDPISDQVSSASNSERIERKAVSSCEGASNSGAMSSTDESNCKLGAFGSELQKFVETIGNQLNNSGTAEISCVSEHHQSQLDEVGSSQSSATTYQTSLESSPSQTGDQNGLYSERNVDFDPVTVSLPQAYGGSTSFLELLQKVGCPGNQDSILRCCNEETTVKDVQSGVDDIKLHDHLRYETERLNDSKSSSIELGILSSNHGVTDTRFVPTEIESLRTPDKDSMLLEDSIDEANKFNEQSCLKCMPPNSKSNTYTAPSDFDDKINKSHDSSGQKNGTYTNLCSLMVPADQDHNEVGKLGFRSLNMTTHLTDTTESIESSKTPKDRASNTVVKKSYASDRAFYESNIQSLKAKRRRVGKDIDHRFDWEGLRKETKANGKTRGKTPETMDSLDYEAVRSAEVNDIAYTIRDRGMNNVLAGRIKDFLNRLVNEHGSIDLEWLRDVPPDQAKEYLLSIRGLGLKSVECVRLLTLHHLAFPVDTNVGRIAVRLGWVPLQPLPESLQLHLLEMYPVQESIQKYLWPRLCKLDQKTLYELHYQMITFGKVFCTKSKPNCNSCPMRGECRHFASAFASARLALPGPEEKRILVPLAEQRERNHRSGQVPEGVHGPVLLLPPIVSQQQHPQENLLISQSLESQSRVIRCEPIIEEPKSPEIECVQIEEKDIEDVCYEESDEIPEIKLNIEEFSQSLQSYIHENMELEEGDVSWALVALTPEAASIPVPKLKNVSMLRTEHHVYELPDSHPLLEGLDRREPDDPCSYLLAIWTQGETATSFQPLEACTSGEIGKLCDKETCFKCNSSREANSHTVRGTLLIPCRTAMRGSFPLNGTYFQVNEVFADHDSSLNPMNIPRKWLWNLPRKTVYFGTSIPTIFKGLSTEGIQQCFWRGYVCVRGFDQKTRAPRPLLARLHFPASKASRTRGIKRSGE